MVKTKVTTGNAADEILKIADEINADLIAMSTHGRSELSRWAFGNVTDKVLRAGITPVLVVRAQKKCCSGIASGRAWASCILAFSGQTLTNALQHGEDSDNRPLYLYRLLS